MKKISSQWVLIMLSSFSFLVLSLTYSLTQPIIDARTNQQLLTLLNIESIQGLTIEAKEEAVPSLQEAGIVRFQRVFEGTTLVGMVYDIETSGYNTGLHFQVGIKESNFQRISIQSSSETIGYGSRLINVLPTLLEGLSIEDEGLITSTFLGMTTGITLTRQGVLNSILAVSTDYKARVGE
jgi:Na+-translocating ferredoxin:NAD+ oxidoreductase RnfG subunit